MAKILWIDDDVYDIQFLLYSVEKNGIIIDKIHHLPEAYDLLKDNHQSYNLIVLDLLMPSTNKSGETPPWLSEDAPRGANGAILLKLIRENLKIKLPVLILSIMGPEAIEDLEIHSEQLQPLQVIRKTPDNLGYLPTAIKELLK
ncbi:MAG: hypothetical protein AAF846_29485 [Chloroflexota bacterium]